MLSIDESFRNKTDDKESTKLNLDVNLEPSSLSVENGIINAFLGDKLNELNENSVYSLAQQFAKYLYKNKLNNVLVVHDGNPYCILFSKIFASTMIDLKIKSYFNFENKGINNAIAIWLANNSNIKFSAVVSFASTLNKSEFKISLFNKNGSYINSIDYEDINNTNYLSLNIPDIQVPQIEKNDINKYIETISSSDNLENVNLLVSNYFNFNEKILNKFFVRNNINASYIKFNPLETKNKKVNETTLARKSILKSWTHKYKCDAIVNFTDNNNGFEFIIKHKKRRKFLTLNDLSIIYLYCLKKYKEEPTSTKEIILNSTSSDFIRFFAKSNNIKVKKQDSLNLDLQNCDNKNILLATDGNNQFVTSANTNMCTDPLLNIRIFLKLVSFFKRQNKTLHDVLMEIYEENKFYRFSKKTEKMTLESSKLFFYRLQHQTKIDEKRILRLEKSQTVSSKIYKIYLENDSHIIFEYIPKYETLNTFFSLWEDKKAVIEERHNKKINHKKKKEKDVYDQHFIQLIIQEKKYIDFLKDLKAEFKVASKFSWKGFIKYTIFIIIVAFLFYFIFQFVLGNAHNENLFNQIHYMLKEQKTYAYMIPVFITGSLVIITINTWLLKRVLMILNENVKLRHLLTAQIIGICISTVTPMLYGGESVGYWYLRRKGAKSAPIAAAFLVQSFFTQLNIVLYSLIFCPIAFVKFLIPFWDPHDAQAVSIVILACLGFLIDIFSAIMISLLTFSWKVQKSIAKNLNKFIEWLPFIIQRDSSMSGAKLQFEFSNINHATKKIVLTGVWWKSTAIFLELLFYRCLARIIDLGIISSLTAHMLENNSAIGYFDAITAGSLVRNVNAVNFITPGGLGISDWAMKNLQEVLFVDKGNTDLVSDYKNINVHVAMVRIIFTMSWLVISVLLLFTIWIGESRIEKYKRVKKAFTEEEIKNNHIKVKTTFYKQSVFYWVIGIALAIMTWYLIYTYVIL